MFWIVDSILMHKRNKNRNEEASGIHYHRSSARYNRLKYNVESGSDSDTSDNDVITVAPRRGHHGNLPVSPVVPVPLEELDSDHKLDSTEL